MKTLEFESRKVVALENEDFDNWQIPIEGAAIDVILVPKQHMQTFRSTDLFQCLWGSMTDSTRIIYC